MCQGQASLQRIGNQRIPKFAQPLNTVAERLGKAKKIASIV